jgi:peptidoglycan hydrolase-like protein with peptidoglycan-binding domain
MSKKRGVVIAMIIGAFSTPLAAQDAQQVMGPFMQLMGTMIEQGARQQEIERYRNSPEFRDQEIQPGGLTRAQVVIVQQLLIQRGFDVGAPDGVIGPKTRAVVAKLQSKAGTPITGNPTQELLDALLQSE